MSASEQDLPSVDYSGLHLWNMSARTVKHPGFHMPGHAGARFFSPDYAGAIIKADTTEMSSSDDLHHPVGPARLAMQESSRIYGSEETIFVTTGSTTGIHVMLASVVTPDTFLLLPRTVHMSVLHAITLLDIKYAFILYPESAQDSFYLFPQLTADVLSRAMERYPEATDILLVTPDYYGKCADLPALAQIAHAGGCRLLVDEAHGSHFAFAEDLFPPDAMSSGADICVQSLHKTLPALTMASQIHISSAAVKSGRISVSRVWSMLSMFETSSPSFVIAASSEYALAWMKEFGYKALAEKTKEIENFIMRLSSSPSLQNIKCELSMHADQLHLVLKTSPVQAFAPDLMRLLEDRGIYIEFADLQRLVLIISPWQSKYDFDILFNALFDCAGQICIRNMQTVQTVFAADRTWGELLTGIPQKAVSLKSAVFGGHERKSVDLSEARGKICASAIAPYPPGIAVLWPGEIISKEHIELLQTLCNLEFEVRGIDKGKIDIIL